MKTFSPYLTLASISDKDQVIPSDQILSRINRENWKRGPDFRNQAAQYNHRRKRLLVMVSYVPEEKGLHVSVSSPGKLPTWEELKMVKNEFIGRHKMAYQVLPPEAEYVNLHPYCLHLWEVMF